MKRLTMITLAVLLASPLLATEYHVSPRGDDDHKGSALFPFRTISAAARVAQPGDIITVHEGTYRERINPPRGGTCDHMRIVYQAAEGDRPVIKGSEIVIGWENVGNGVWKVTLPESYFGGYNPYRDLIHGDWFRDMGRDHHTGEVFLNEEPLAEATSLDALGKLHKNGQRYWYCQSDDDETTIWADFGDVDPGEACVEISVRQACFYPDTPGRNYITVRGFRMCQAATQWAAPTAEQIGLIGTHWSKGWIIEDNVISDSRCVGVTLGKDRATGHNDAQSAEGYNVVVRRALKAGWSRENIGSHIVRHNHVYNCGAAGICGSMGAAFSKIVGNHIHHIHMDKPFSGAEMAGIKIHAAIDTLIRDNYVHHTCRGLWLDWMAQGTRVTRNLFHDNHAREDLFVEVNHGPYVIDNNIFLSRMALNDWSEGGAFVHNLMAGNMARRTAPRETPYHKQHSTDIVGLKNITGGDNRFHNNIISGGQGLKIYDDAALPMQIDGNVYLNGATPCQQDVRYALLTPFNPEVRITTEADGVYLHMTLPPSGSIDGQNRLITTDMLGKAKIPNLPFMNYCGAALKIDTDYFGNRRDAKNPTAGPFETPKEGEVRLKVWPVER